jgi:sigma-E factor negative regulatory protein RseA
MEKLSELMDGELDSREASIYIGRIKSDPGLKENWELYHLVGDAIRKERVLANRISAGVSSRLAQEPVILAPRRLVPQPVARYALSAAAGLAGVAVVAWVAFNTQPTNLDQTPRTDVAVQTQLATPKPVALATQEAEVEDYLLAHQSVSSFRTMHGSLPYMRAAAVEEVK